MSEDVHLHERVARIELAIEHIDDRQQERIDQIDRLEAKLDALDRDLQRYRGLVGGILLVVTAVATALKFFGEYVTGMFK